MQNYTEKVNLEGVKTVSNLIDKVLKKNRSGSLIVVNNLVYSILYEFEFKNHRMIDLVPSFIQDSEISSALLITTNKGLKVKVFIK